MDRRSFLQNAGLAGAGLILGGSANKLFANGSWMAPPANPYNLRFRHVHLDFHTSELIQDVAANFDPTAFAKTLKNAYVNSVNLFGRCHHGMIYYDTKKHPERKHPALKRNLLKEQIEACHKLDIRTPIYTTIGWDHFTAEQHPEWLLIDETGKIMGTEPLKPGFYREMDVSTAYMDFLKAHITDLFESVPVDGLWLDIVRPLHTASNRRHTDAMIKKGLNIHNHVHRNQYFTEIIDNFKHEMSAHIRKHDKNVNIFYNGGHVGPDIYNTITDNSHLELESLPSGGWGYMHFPLTGRYARTQGLDLLGMTGKFHRSWGDFHSLKNQAAMEYEIFTMLALNAKCSIGDQLHPRGVLDRATYDLIGKVYGSVEKKEPWCEDAKAVVDIGVFSPEAFNPPHIKPGWGRVPEPARGVVRILQEGNHMFDVIDQRADLSKYKLLIMPDSITLDADMTKKVEAFVAKGGSLIASFDSGLTQDKKQFASNIFGASLVGKAPYSPDFMVTKGPIAKGLPETELVMYMGANEIKVNKDTNVLADVNVPYFNRTYEHFSSHNQTPSAEKKGYPGIIQKGKVIYFAHPVFEQYSSNAPVWCKKLVLNAIERLMPVKALTTDGPSTILSALNDQPAKGRLVTHILHYIAERRGEEFDVIEEIIPLYNLNVTVNTNKKIKAAKLVPENTTIKFTQKGDTVVFNLAKLNGHQMIELAYK
jgi:hypothetical protein